MFKPTFEEFKKSAKSFNVIPVFHEILADTETPVSTYLKLAKNHPYTYLLESVEGGERWGRYSFISWSPEKVFISKGKSFACFKPGEKIKYSVSDDPYSELKSMMSGIKASDAKGLPRFWGGAVGFFAYDIVRFFESLPNKSKDMLGIADALYMFTDKLVIFDHLSHTVKIVYCVKLKDEQNLKATYDKVVKEIKKIEVLLKKPLKLSKQKQCKPYQMTANMSKAHYKKNIEKAKEYIKAGDIFQVVPSQRFERKTDAKPFDIYRSLRLVNPSPYMFYMKMNDMELVGSSPEILVRKEEKTAEVRPIAGTCRRGADENEDKVLIEKLLADPKERAEHVMLVDLGRNDLGRVCAAKTVTVPVFMDIEKYSHVIHIASSVVGTLKPGMESFELLKACFPAGTVSGAPKIRAMEIIDELEPQMRGAYAGAVGYFSYSGNMDMAITIRTLVVKDKKAYAQSGVGVVADSIPENEYMESVNKAKALFVAIDIAEKGI